MGIPVPDAIDSELGDEYGEIPDDLSSLIGSDANPDTDYPTMTFTESDVIDAQLASDLAVNAAPKERRSRSRANIGDDAAMPREPKSGPPSLDEWSKFLSRVVFRTFCDMYINYATRGIDESAFSERDLDRLVMTDDELKLVVTPLAEISNKSKFMRKHGRMIVASGDSINALIVLGAWMSRVNRIATKYRPKNVRGNVTSRQGAESATEAPNGYSYGTSGGRIPDGFTGFIHPGNS